MGMGFPLSGSSSARNTFLLISPDCLVALVRALGVLLELGMC